MTPLELKKATLTAGHVHVVCAYFTTPQHHATIKSLVERHNESSHVLIYTVDVDTSHELVSMYDVRQTPTFLFFHKGDEVLRCGVRDADDAFTTVNKLVSNEK